LLNKNNPNISVANQVDVYDASDKYDMTANGFKIAFGVAEFRTSSALDDPEYVMW
jgi:hypothetical protein